MKSFAIVAGLGAGLVVCLAQAVLFAAIAAAGAESGPTVLADREIPESLLVRYERSPRNDQARSRS
ncbi:MAG TPA: hypothetical protein VLL08_25810 [Kineosporiaceae bacterium]|nr:hypothetical protein [Kineosporiaceae bacterium]